MASDVPRDDAGLSAHDEQRVTELLGRSPRGRYEVVVRDDAGDPVVLRNAPLLDDGTPMPTRYWLVGAEENRRVGQLESEGGVDRAEAEVDPAALADSHARYAAERDAEIAADHTGPRPSGGVGGTRVGVKCLHAHWAWHLAGGDDPVGRWIEQQFEARDRLTLAVGPGSLDVRWRSERWELPVGTDELLQEWLRDGDPPRPAALTNALGLVADHLDDIVRAQPDIAALGQAHVTGDAAWAIAQLESGVERPASPFDVDRDTVEEVFRLAATESRAERADNPGLPSSDVDVVLAGLCAVVGAMRRLTLERITIVGSVGPR